MNRKAFIVAITLATATLAPGGAALAGSVAGFGGGTEVTQIMNNIELVQSNAQLLKTFQNHLQQYETMITNLKKNPASVMSGDMARLVNGIGKIMDAEQSMGGTMARIDQQFGTVFGSQQAKDYSKDFTRWTTASQSTLRSALQAAGSHRDNFGSETDALNALYSKAQSSDGNLAALQTLSEINVEAASQTLKLRDLMTSQATAANTYMLEQQAKQQQTRQANDNIWTFEDKPLSAPRPTKKGNF